MCNDLTERSLSPQSPSCELHRHGRPLYLSKMNAATLRTVAAGHREFTSMHYEAAAPYYKIVLARCDSVGYRGIEFATASNNLAACLIRTDAPDHASATRFSDQAVAAISALDQSDTCVLNVHAQCLQFRGDLLSQTGRITESLAAYDESLSMFRQAGSKCGEAFVLAGIADQSVFTGDVDSGLLCLDQASRYCLLST